MVASSVSLKQITNSDEDSNSPGAWFELALKGTILKYTFQIVGPQTAGVQPRDGYPLYIVLHGGGTDPAWKNNNEWRGCATSFFHDPIKEHHAKDGAIIVALRGMSNTWDLHWQPQSYALISQLITRLLERSPTELNGDTTIGVVDYRNLLNPNATSLVNPNRVFLWGFSAGGDGAFVLGMKLSDRLAGVIAAAGHPNGTRLYHAANVPMCLEVGEDDWNWGGGTQPFQRGQVYIETMRDIVAACPSLAPANDTSHYSVACNIVRNIHRKVVIEHKPGWLSQNDRAINHNYWHQPGMINTEQQILIPTPAVFNNWYSKILPTWWNTPSDFDRQVDSSNYQPMNINPLLWAAPRVRDPYPTTVVWDLYWRPDIEKVVKTWEGRRFWYWLYLRKPESLDLRGPIEKEQKNPDQKLYQPERVSYNKDQNWLHIPQPNDYLGFLINEKMLRLDDPAGITVFVGPQRTASTMTKVKVSPVASIQRDTLAARRDPNYQFSAMIYLEKSEAGWNVKTASSLDDGVGGQSRL